MKKFEFEVFWAVTNFLMTLWFRRGTFYLFRGIGHQQQQTRAYYVYFLLPKYFMCILYLPTFEKNLK